jgi:uncharacterized protein YqeY
LTGNVWSLIIHSEERDIRTIITMFPSKVDNGALLNTEDEIKEKMEATMLYKLMRKMRKSSVELDEAMRQDIVENKFPNLKKGLTKIFMLVDN